MPKISEKPLRIIQIRIFEEDYQRLRKIYGQGIGINRACRTILHTFLTQTEAKINEAIDKMEAEEPVPKVPESTDNDIDIGDLS